MKIIHIKVVLASFLREFAQKSQWEFMIEIPEGKSVNDLLHQLKIPEERVGMILVNGKGQGIDFSPEDGDRMALFPPETAFNNYVATGFRKDSSRFKRER